MILINNWGNDFLFALLDQKEQIEQFTNLASKHVQEWIEGGQFSQQTTDGSQLLPIQSDVATQGYTVRANLEPRSTQVV